jgi:hypothetical protein
VVDCRESVGASINGTSKPNLAQRIPPNLCTGVGAQLPSNVAPKELSIGNDTIESTTRAYSKTEWKVLSSLAVALAVNRLVNNVDQHIGVLRMTPFTCDKCGHVQVFKT